jgi:hypothetical protein
MENHGQSNDERVIAGGGNVNAGPVIETFLANICGFRPSAA